MVQSIYSNLITELTTYIILSLLRTTVRFTSLIGFILSEYYSAQETRKGIPDYGFSDLSAKSATRMYVNYTYILISRVPNKIIIETAVVCRYRVRSDFITRSISNVALHIIGIAYRMSYI